MTVKRLINEGWKSSNSWRGGFFRQVEFYMKEKLPHSDIRGEPHVNSKLTVWKREYVLMFEFMKLSGVAIEPALHMIVVDQHDIWDNYVKIVPDVKNFCGKTFPYYEHWCEIFGKDRAIGEHATFLQLLIIVLRLIIIIQKLIRMKRKMVVVFLK